MAAEPETVNGRRRMVGALLALALLGAGVMLWRAGAAQGAVADRVPLLPDLAAWPEELQHRARAADRGARGYLRPARRLGELGRLYHANGFFEEALQCYDVLQQIEPAEARWPHLQASILATNGLLTEAAPQFQRAAALADGYLPSHLRLGDVLLKGNHTADAARAYQRVLALRANEPYALLGLARCAIAGQDWELARKHVRQCIAANPEFIGGLSLMATVHEHFGETAEADRMRDHVNGREFVDLLDPWVEALMEDCYDPYRLSVAAAVANFRADDTRAERWLRRAIELSPKPAPYYRQLAKLQMRREDFSAARRSFEQATALAPEDSDAWTLLVGLLNTMGDRPSAYRAAIQGLAKCSESRGLHFAYGQMLGEDGRYPQAIAELQHAKRIQPTEVNAYVELAIVHFKLGEIEAGMEEMRAALAVQPDQPVALIVLTRDAIEKGDEPGAREWIRRVRLQRRVRADDRNAVVAQFQDKFGAAP